MSIYIYMYMYIYIYTLEREREIDTYRNSGRQSPPEFLKTSNFDLRRQHYDSPTRNQWHPLWHLGFRLIHRIRLPEHLSYISRRRKTDSSDSLTPRFLQLLRPGAVMCKMPCAVLEFEIPLKLKGLNEVLVLVVFLFHF